MCDCRRRTVLELGVGLLGTLLADAHACLARGARMPPVGERRFIAEAERMRRAAVAVGDQSYGAVVVKDDTIVGWGPSRVVVDRNPDAHAERVAIWDAQARLGMKDLSGSALYSTSRACGDCEAAAAAARVAAMYWGPQGHNAGAPKA